MKILVTGSNGFLGQNLIQGLKYRGYTKIFQYDIGKSRDDLKNYCIEADFIFHLAGINRPKEKIEFIHGNIDFTQQLLDLLYECNNMCPILFSSSIQAEIKNPYGNSKQKAENLLYSFGQTFGSKIYNFRLPNVFGKWSRPNYNSAIATFCHNISRDLPVHISEPQKILKLVYIDDIVDDFISVMNNGVKKENKFYTPGITYSETLQKIVDLLNYFKETRKNLGVPKVSDPFIKKLYSTYLSFLPQNQFSYKLGMHADKRGSFTEFLKIDDFGQISINISKPGIIKGNHWHHTKIEKFLVVSGTGIIRFRQLFSDKILEYNVSSEKLEVVDIPPGYIHNIENTGEEDLVTLIWANEFFDDKKPDTILGGVFLNE